MPWTEINGVKTFVAADATETPAGVPATPAGAGKKSWVARHKILTAIGGSVAAVALIAAVAPSDPAPATTPSSQTQQAAQTPTQPVAQPEAKTEASAEVKPQPVVEPEPEPARPSTTRAQDNAVRKAEDYLDTSAFSRKGLIDQLKFEGFTVADATYGVDHVEVSWNEQAEKKAADYLEMSAFSRSGLIEQLEFEGFTAAQAKHGATKAGL